jgi:O-antigen/teichoic acid export membrane protein
MVFKIFSLNVLVLLFSKVASFSLVLALSLFSAIEFAGMFSTIIAYSAIVSSIAVSGLGAYYLKISPNQKNLSGRADAMYNINVLSFLLLIIVLIILFVLDEIRLLNVGGGVLNYILIISPFFAIATLASFYLRASDKTMQSQLVLITPNLFVVVYVLLMRNKVEHESYFEYMVASYILGFIISCILFRLKEFFVADFYWPFKFSVKEIFPFVFISFAAVLTNEVDVLMISNMLGFDEVAIYRLGFSISSFIMLSLTVTGIIVSHKVASAFRERKFDYLDKLFKSSILLNLFFSVPVVIVVFNTSPYFIEQFFAPPYLEAVRVISVYSFTYLILSVLGVVSFFAIYCDLQKVVAVNLLFSALLNIFLNFILIPKYSLVGAALATSISSVFSYFILYIMYRRHMNRLRKVVV